MSYKRTLTIEFTISGDGVGADRANTLRDRIAAEITCPVDSVIQEFCEGKEIECDYLIKGRIKE